MREQKTTEAVPKKENNPKADGRIRRKQLLILDDDSEEENQEIQDNPMRAAEGETKTTAIGYLPSRSVQTVQCEQNTHNRKKGIT